MTAGISVAPNFGQRIIGARIMPLGIWPVTKFNVLEALITFARTSCERRNEPNWGV
jgi:hypothetical protein